MMEIVEELLLNSLNGLINKELNLFQWHLRHHGFSVAELENADVLKTIDKMVNRYGPEEAVETTLKILRKMNKNDLAERLENKHKEEQVNFSETTKNHTQEKEILKLQKNFQSHKISMKEKAESIFEGKKEIEIDLKDVYTELFITEGDMKEVNSEHEILKIDDILKSRKSQDRPIKCNEIFHSQRDKKKKKIILTKGIAGIGKTVSVQKLILDWAEGTANQNIDAMFLFPFREINLIKNKHISFHKFLLEFYPELKKLETTNITKLIEEYNVVFIFDGLDESHLLLNFESRKLTNVEESSSVDELFINLVKGDLLPSAFIWVTSRPAAANQIPPEFVGLFTEVRGFNDQQKEEYFKKRIKDENQANKMINHIKKSRSLFIMCHIPVFCWIMATVLLIQNNDENIDLTLTEMYIHFLLIQVSIKNQKYDGINIRECKKLLESNKTIILKLAKLAFEQLKKENIIFYEEDLQECGIYVSKDSEYTGMIAEIFKKESGLHETKIFSFIHLSVQEFLAALHVFICYKNNNMKELEFFFTPEPGRNIALHDILENAIVTAIRSKKGHLDLFLRFLMGISLESSQKLLKGLLTHTEDTTNTSGKTIKWITDFLDNVSDEVSVNLFYCLLELKDQSLYEATQTHLLNTTIHFRASVSPSMCTFMMCVLHMSEKVLDEFDMKKYSITFGYENKLVPAVSYCKRALFNNCNMNGQSCEIVASALQSSNCPLRELDMSNNDLTDSGVKLISDALQNPNCKLEILRLSGCMVTAEGCGYLASALNSNPSHLKELDLSYNHPEDLGVSLLSHRLNDTNCTLNTLNLDHGGEFTMTPRLYKYASDLTLDPNTAHPCLVLSEENRKVTSVDKEQPYPDHPGRFDEVHQVLCRKSLTGRCYWEAEFTDRAIISVAYEMISRKGTSDDNVFGSNTLSWSLEHCDHTFYAWHNNKKVVCYQFLSDKCKRVGVYVDWSAGTLSFYLILNPDIHIHIHTFNTTFTQPLYAGFTVFKNSPVSLCEMKWFDCQPPSSAVVKRCKWECLAIPNPYIRFINLLFFSLLVFVSIRMLQIKDD